MTETFIRAVAERFGLDVLKRVTTGTEARGFATFELSGPTERVLDAWDVMKDQGRGTAFDKLTYINNPQHPDQGKPFIQLESVWFD